jgi:hypothetical protein
MGAMRNCAHCGGSKSPDGYYKSTPWVCKECHKARSKKRIKENPKARRESNWRQRGINITHEEYEERYASQEGVCRVCRRAETVSGRLLAVDHDHNTGAIRGLLCTKCNTTCGWIEQYPEIISYLRKDM